MRRREPAAAQRRSAASRKGSGDCVRTCSRVEEGTHSTTMEWRMGRVEEETEAKGRRRRRKRRHKRGAVCRAHNGGGGRNDACTGLSGTVAHVAHRWWKREDTCMEWATTMAQAFAGVARPDGTGVSDRRVARVRCKHARWDHCTATCACSDGDGDVRRVGAHGQFNLARLRCG